MPSEERKPVEVSRRIAAPAAHIFGILVNPKRHVDLDGSGMLRGAVSDEVISGVGDVFVMSMHFPRLGDYEMNNHVVEYEHNRRIGWEPEAGRGHPAATATDARWGQRWTYELEPDGPEATTVTESYDCSQVPTDERVSMQDGRVWLDTMATTLERLDELCTGEAVQPTSTERD